MLKIPSPHVWSHRMLFLVTRNHRNMRIEDGIFKIWISRQNFSPKFALGRVKMCVSNRKKSIKRGKKVSNPAARRMRVDLKKKKKKKKNDRSQPIVLSLLPASSLLSILSPLSPLLSPWARKFQNQPKVAQPTKSSQNQIKFANNGKKWLKLSKISQTWLKYARKG